MRVLFLDLDDTLLSFDETVKDALSTGFARFGIAPYTPECFRVFSNTTDALWKELEKGNLSFEDIKRERFAIIFKQLGIDFDGRAFEAFFREFMMTSAIPEPGAGAMLRRLYGHFILCAASNGPQQQQLMRLEKADMLHYFDYVFTSEDIGVQKPSLGFFDGCFDEIRKTHHVIPDSAVIIGDSLTSDISGGIAYGLKTCLYNAKRRPVAPDLSIDRIVYSLDEIDVDFINLI